MSILALVRRNYCFHICPILLDFTELDFSIDAYHFRMIYQLPTQDESIANARS